MVKARYATPNSQQEAGIVLAHTMHGEPVHTHGIQNASGENTQKQVQPIMAAYKPPVRHEDDKVLCSAPDCKAWPSKKFAPYCPGHARSLGLAPTCIECKSPPVGDTKWCHHHQPKAVTDDDTG